MKNLKLIFLRAYGHSRVTLSRVCLYFACTVIFEKRINDQGYVLVFQVELEQLDLKVWEQAPQTTQKNSGIPEFRNPESGSNGTDFVNVLPSPNPLSNMQVSSIIVTCSTTIWISKSLQTYLITLRL